MATKENEIATVSNNTAIADFSAIGEELEGLGSITFDTVKVPSGGGIMFELPGDDPNNPEMVREIVGVIVGRQAKNGYWASAFGQSEDAHPDCYSPDGKTGFDRATGECIDCASCPRNQFKADGSGKDCKNMQDLYILPEGEMLPIKIVIPPTSIGNLRDYLAKRVVAKRKKSYEVLTKLTLSKEKSRQNIAYSQIQFAKVRDLDADESSSVKPVIGLVKETIARQMQEPEADYAEVQEDLPDEFK